MDSNTIGAREKAFGQLGRGKTKKASLPPPFPSLSSLFFSPNREPVHRLTPLVGLLH